MQKELYTEPIFLNQNNSPVNNSTIPTSDRWIKPKQTPFKANVIRAIVYRNGRAMSKVYTHTYFIHPKMETKYTFPIVSIIVDSKYYSAILMASMLLARIVIIHKKVVNGNAPPFFNSLISQGCQLQQKYWNQNLWKQRKSYASKSLLLYARSEYGKSA